MNYNKIYNDLITRSKFRILSEYKETHHIVPRCLGGTNDLNNLVDLTPEEHYLAHQLLVKIHPGNKSLIYAVSAMCMSAHSKGMIRNNKMYGWIRRAISEIRKGVPRSVETRAKIKAKRKLQLMNPETGLKISKKAKGRKLSDQWKANISSGQKGRIVTPDTRNKISESNMGQNKGKTYEEIYGEDKARELKEIRSKSMKGKPKSEETRKKLSDANKGKVLSEESRNKISMAHKGKVTSDETKRKISETKHRQRLENNLRDTERNV